MFATWIKFGMFRLCCLAALSIILTVTFAEKKVSKLKCEKKLGAYSKKCGNYCETPKKLTKKCKKAMRNLVRKYATCNFAEKCQKEETNSTEKPPEPDADPDDSDQLAESNGCVHGGIDYEGATIATRFNVSMIGDCVSICTLTDFCRAVSYNATSLVCLLKNKTEGNAPHYEKHMISINLPCLVKEKQLSEGINGCIKQRVEFYGGTMRQYDEVVSLEKCLEICKKEEGCVGITYRHGRHCVTKFKYEGVRSKWCGDCQSISFGCMSQGLLPVSPAALLISSARNLDKYCLVITLITTFRTLVQYY